MYSKRWECKKPMTIWRSLKRWWQPRDTVLYSLASWGSPATCWLTSQSASWGCLWLSVTGKDQSQCPFMQSFSSAKSCPPCNSSRAVWSNFSCQWNQTDSVFCHCMHGGIFQHCSFLFFLSSEINRIVFLTSKSIFMCNFKICFLFPVSMFEILD